MRSGAKDIDYVYHCHNATMTKNMLFAKSKRPHLQDPLINISTESFLLIRRKGARGWKLVSRHWLNNNLTISPRRDKIANWRKILELELVRVKTDNAPLTLLESLHLTSDKSNSQNISIWSKITDGNSVFVICSTPRTKF